MKQKKDQNKVNDELSNNGILHVMPNGTLYPVIDTKPLQILTNYSDTIKQPLLTIQGTLDSFQKTVQEITIPAVDLGKTFSDQLVGSIRIADNFGKAIAPQYLQSVTVMQDLLKSTQDSLKVIGNSVVTDFPLKDTFLKIDTSTVFDLGVKSAEIIDLKARTVSFSSVARQKTDIGIWSFETEQSLVLKVDRIEEKVDSVQALLVEEIYPFLIEDSKRKDDVLDQLLAFYKGKPQIFAKVKEIVFSDRTSKLHIDSIEIPLQPNTNEELLCGIVFKNLTTASRLWNTDEIVEEMGEDIEQTRTWKKRIYQTARQLNEKIVLATGLKEFLVYTMSTLCVNPIYLTPKK